MAKIIAPSFKNRIYQGPYGNLSLHKTYVTLKAAAVNDVVELTELPLGVEITGIRVLTDGLGAGVKLTIKSGDKTLASDIAVSAATSNITNIQPYYVGGNGPEKLTATITGSAATGQVFVLVEYVFVGY